MRSALRDVSARMLRRRRGDRRCVSNPLGRQARYVRDESIAASGTVATYRFSPRASPSTRRMTEIDVGEIALLDDEPRPQIGHQPVLLQQFARPFDEIENRVEDLGFDRERLRRVPGEQQAPARIEPEIPEYVGDVLPRLTHGRRSEKLGKFQNRASDLSHASEDFTPRTGGRVKDGSSLQEAR